MVKTKVPAQKAKPTLVGKQKKQPVRIPKSERAHLVSALVWYNLLSYAGSRPESQESVVINANRDLYNRTISTRTVMMTNPSEVAARNFVAAVDEFVVFMQKRVRVAERRVYPEVARLLAKLK